MKFRMAWGVMKVMKFRSKMFQTYFETIHIWKFWNIYNLHIQICINICYYRCIIVFGCPKRVNPGKSTKFTNFIQTNPYQNLESENYCTHQINLGREGMWFSSSRMNRTKKYIASFISTKRVQAGQDLYIG